MSEELMKNIYLNGGAWGLMLLGLVWFSKILFRWMMKQIDEFKHMINELQEENKRLESDFREYLIETAKEHHEVIKANTDVHNKIVKVLEYYMK